MRLSRILMVVGIVAVVSPSFAGEGKPFSISLKGSFTTGSQLFPSPNSSDEFERAQFFSINDVWGYGVELRYRFPQTDIAIAISSDYLRSTEETSLRLSGRTIPVKDGYQVIPVEVTGYFIIPISGEVFGVYMGGGAGAYFGKRIYSIGNTEAPSIDQGVGFGIHVLSGVSYRLHEMFSVQAEMKFRDLQFNSVNQFSSPRIAYGSTMLSVPTEPFQSRVHTDGIILQIGVVVDF